jgi:RNA polymerase sigma-70 factor (ECF subfamily)
VEGRPLEVSDSTDTGLVEHARRGDAAAFGLLVQRHQAVAFRVAYLVSGELDEAEDIAQDAFVKAYMALPRFHSGAPFRPWLLQIVANEARNRRRSSGRRAHLALRAAADERSLAAGSGGAAPSPELAALADEERRALLHAVDSLHAADRQAIAYRYFLDLSEAEMAAALGCARGTVKSRLSRALGRLRQQLTSGAVWHG